MIARWSSPAAGDAEPMPGEILTRLGGAVRRHPWWKARARLTIRWLRRAGIAPGARVLDAGCGWGVTLESLESAGYEVTGLDVCGGALEWLDAQKGGRRLVEGDLERGFDLLEGAERPRFDAVVALDVIEHLDDDAKALRVLADCVRPGGILLVSVPAGPELFGEFDAIQGHRRRYTADSLGAAFGRAGLRAGQISGWGRCLVPLARWQRRTSKGVPGEPEWRTYERYLTVPGRLTAWGLETVLGLEAAATVRGWGRAGTSLLAMARVEDGEEQQAKPRHPATRLITPCQGRTPYSS